MVLLEVVLLTGSEIEQIFLVERMRPEQVATHARLSAVGVSLSTLHISPHPRLMDLDVLLLLAPLPISGKADSEARLLWCPHRLLER